MDEAERAQRQARREQWALGALARHQATIDDLLSRATTPTDWLGVERHCRRTAAILATWSPERMSPVVAEAADGTRHRLGQALDQAERVLESLGSSERAEAEAHLGRKIAVIGKGGAGKTVISSTLARVLARRGRPVLLVDLDTCPGSSYSVGLRGADVPLPPEALEESSGASYGWQLRSDLLARQVVERHAGQAPDGVRFLSLGKIGSADKSEARKTVTGTIQTLTGFAEPGWDVVADLEAGPTTPFERYHAFADTVLVVVGPAWRSALTARRLLPMVDPTQRAVLVANRFSDEPDHPGLVPEIRIPFDPEVAEAERQGLSPVDACPSSPTVATIVRLADQLIGPVAVAAP